MTRRIVQLVVLLPVGVVIGLLLVVATASMGEHLKHSFGHKPTAAEVEQCIHDQEWKAIANSWDDTPIDPAARQAECAARR